MDLFTSEVLKPIEPLAHRVRPKKLEEWFGHSQIRKGPILSWIRQKRIPSLLFWGPPGVGKTTLAYLIAEELGDAFISLSAVTSGVKEIKEAAERASYFAQTGRRTLLFFDEIHRLNKSQQDALLPFVEQGRFTLVGATTENPSFEVNAALLSRMRVFRLERLSTEVLVQVLNRALVHAEGLNGQVKIDDVLLAQIAESSEGDARRALTLLEAYAMHVGDQLLSHEESLEVLKSLGEHAMPYDKKSDQHYDTISAFIKSMRASDPDATVYYLARMLESGEDPMFIARRMIIFASEDVGNAEPRALPLVIAAQQALHVIGMPEARINLAHAAISLALAKKSRAMYNAIESALAEVRETGALPIPNVLKNPVTKLMKDIGYGKGNPSQRLPEGLKKTSFYDRN